MTNETTVRGACPHDCPDTCALISTVRDGRVIKVRGNPDHPATDGVLCHKVSRYPERLYHPDRLTTPLKRVGAKGAGRFAPVCWDEALDAIATRLKPIAARAPEAILPYSYAGTMGLVQSESISARFFHALGASRLDRTICASAGAEALKLTLGGKLGMQVQQFAQSRLILIWGANPVVSSVHFWHLAQEAKRAGAKLICIDPRRSETAQLCHEHIALLPGTDAALAMGIAHELVAHDWLDHDYLREYVQGFADWRERVAAWTPERVASVCGIEAAVVRQLAHDYAHIKPAAIRLNYGMQRVRGGGNAVRAIVSLPALTGAWRHPAGGVLLSNSGSFPIDRDYLERADLCPTYPKLPRLVNMSQLGQALLHPGGGTFGARVEALIVYDSNPLAVAPDSAQVVRGMAREDLFTVVLEHFQTDTADYADFVLPATMQMEHLDIHTSYGHTDVLWNHPAVAAPGECRPNSAIFRALAERMGLHHPALQEDDLSLAEHALHWDDPRLPADALSTLQSRGWVSLQLPDAPFAQGHFPTPSGRCEIASTVLQKSELDALPDYLPNFECPAPANGAAAVEAATSSATSGTRGRANTAYPLAMISPPARNFLNSSFVNIAHLQAQEGKPWLEIHAADATPRGIADGDLVRVFNDRGSYHCHARLNQRARPGVVNGIGIWWRKLGANGVNVNELTHQGLTDIGGGACFYDCVVQVERLEQAAQAA